MDNAQQPRTLKDVMPTEFCAGEYNFTPAFKLRDRTVLRVFSSTSSSLNYPAWPGPSKNVGLWVVLDNGKLVGWNENISLGWSFPVMRPTKELLALIMDLPQ